MPRPLPFSEVREETQPALGACGEDILKEGPALVEGGDWGSEREGLRV